MWYVCSERRSDVVVLQSTTIINHVVITSFSSVSTSSFLASSVYSIFSTSVYSISICSTAFRDSVSEWE